MKVVKGINLLDFVSPKVQHFILLFLYRNNTSPENNEKGAIEV